MGATLNQMMIDVGNDYTYEDNYITFFESHLKYLREAGSTVRITLDAPLVYKNRNDFYGLFQDMGFPMEDWNLYIRVNGFHHYTDLTEELTTLLIPSAQVIAGLKLLYRTSQTRV